MPKQFRRIKSTISFAFPGLSGLAFSGRQNRVGTGISSELEDNSSQSSTAKGKLVSGRKLLQLGNLVPLIISTTIPYSGPSRNRWKASRSGWGSIVFPPVQGPRGRFTEQSPATYPSWNERLCSIFLASRAQEHPRNAASDLRLERI